MTQKALLFVGSINRRTPYFQTAEGEGLSVLSFDEASGAIAPLSVMKGIDNPAFVSVHPQRRAVFATSEVYGWNEGVVTACRFDPRDGTLRYINKQPTLGSLAAHNGLDRSGNYLFVTNYAHDSTWDGFYGEDIPGQAVAVFPIDENGRLGPATSSVAHQGTGPDKTRQNEPHPHCALASPDNRFVFVPDLGIDAVVVYRFSDGQLTRHGAVSLPPGSGPRHLKFSPDGRSLYVINELASTVAHFAYDGANGALDRRQIISTLPDGFDGVSTCSELQISPDGRFLYGANRGHDSVAAFRIDPATGNLESLGQTACGGRMPRNIGLSPSGSHLFACNQNSHTLAIFRRDAESGGLEQVGAFETGTPMVVVSVPLGAA